MYPFLPSNILETDDGRDVFKAVIVSQSTDGVYSKNVTKESRQSFFLVTIIECG